MHGEWSYISMIVLNSETDDNKPIMIPNTVVIMLNCGALWRSVALCQLHTFYPARQIENIIVVIFAKK